MISLIHIVSDICLVLGVGISTGVLLYAISEGIKAIRATNNIVRTLKEEAHYKMRYIDLLRFRDMTFRDILVRTAPFPDVLKVQLAELLEKALLTTDESIKLKLLDLYGREEADRMLNRKCEIEEMLV
jgi:hypothetical protein